MKAVAATGWEAAASQVMGPAALESGDCCAWPLALDSACAAEARSVFGEAVAFLRLPDEQLCDASTMVSELASNTLHAHDNVELDAAGAWPLAGAPELWVYLRRAGSRWELVCKIFDSLTGWRPGRPPVPGGPPPESQSGHGLQVVAGLSGGRWGHHLTRSRLGGWKVPGKAVWFAQPAGPAEMIPSALRRSRVAPAQLACTLEKMLAQRGLGSRLVCADEPATGMSVISVRSGLTIWCRENGILWRTRTGHYQWHAPADVVEVTEQAVAVCEEMDRGLWGGSRPGWPALDRPGHHRRPGGGTHPGGGAQAGREGMAVDADVPGRECQSGGDGGDERVRPGAGHGGAGRGDLHGAAAAVPAAAAPRPF